MLRAICPSSGAIARALPRARFTAPISQLLPRSTAYAKCAWPIQRRTLFANPPQVIKGTVNDPTPIPAPDKTHGSWHWTAERSIAVALIPLTIAPFIAGSLHPVTDAILAATLIVHSHIGFQSCIIDYFPCREFPKLGSMMHWVLRVSTILVLLGFYEYNTNDVGLTETIRRIWTAKKEPKEPKN